VMLNPPGDYLMQYNDKVLVLAEDNDTFSYGSSNDPERTPVPPYDLPPKFPEKILLAGWRRDFEDLITELDKWVPPNSMLTLFNRKSVKYMKAYFNHAGLDFAKDLENITKVEMIQGDPCSGVQLERLGKLDPTVEGDFEDRIEGTTYRVEEYDLALALSVEASGGDGMSADSRVMVSMLIMRHIEKQRSLAKQRSGQKNSAKRVMVSEILDPRTNKLMSLTETSSVVGNELVAMMLAQVSEDRDIGYVLEDLFSEAGQEMHLKDIRMFVAPNELLCWWELVDRCMQRAMLPVGWIRKSLNEDGSINSAIEINPAHKDEKLLWKGDDGGCCDELIVISED